MDYIKRAFLNQPTTKKQVEEMRKLVKCLSRKLKDVSAHGKARHASSILTLEKQRQANP